MELYTVYTQCGALVTNGILITGLYANQVNKLIHGRGQGDRVLFVVTSDRFPVIQQTKDGRAIDSSCVSLGVDIEADCSHPASTISAPH